MRGRGLPVFDQVGMPDVPTRVPAGRIDSSKSLAEGCGGRSGRRRASLSHSRRSARPGPEEFARLQQQGKRDHLPSRNAA